MKGSTPDYNMEEKYKNIGRYESTLSYVTTS